MKVYCYEITSLLFLDRMVKGRIEKKTHQIEVSATNYLDGMYKALDNLKQELRQNEEYNDCISSNWAYFNVRNVI